MATTASFLIVVMLLVMRTHSHPGGGGGGGKTLAAPGLTYLPPRPSNLLASFDSDSDEYDDDDSDDSDDDDDDHMVTGFIDGDDSDYRSNESYDDDDGGHLLVYIQVGTPAIAIPLSVGEVHTQEFPPVAPSKPTSSRTSGKPSVVDSNLVPPIFSPSTSSLYAAPSAVVPSPAPEISGTASEVGVGTGIDGTVATGGGGSQQQECPTICGFDYSPVCGTDGVTYTNDCTLQVAICKNPALAMDSPGSCAPLPPSGVVDPPTVPPRVTPPPPPPPVPSVTIPTPPPRPPPSVTIPTPPPRPVPSVTIPTPTPYPLPPSSTTPAPEEDCPQACTRIYNPVCGSDGVTYNNQCLLNVAICTSRSLTLTRSYEGQCDDSPAGTVDSGIGGGTGGYVPPEVPFESCDNICTKEYIPVCGSDSKTYSNICSLENAACLSRVAGGSTITFASDGACESQTGAVDSGVGGGIGGYVPPEVPSESCDIICTKEYIPVCGSDSKTYSNICSLENAACLSRVAGGPTITFASDGACGIDPIDTGSASFSVVEEPAPVNPPQSACPEECTKIFLPVCGSDGQTYNNECLFRIAACRARQAGASDLRVVYAGPCGPAPDPVPAEGPLIATFGLSDADGPTASGFSQCPEACPTQFNPVCGADGQTYTNLCSLEKASCDSEASGRPAINKDFDGPCVAALPQEPKCDEACDRRYEPVCGSDGETYNNLCLLSVANCLSSFFSITVVSDGPCGSSTSASEGAAPPPPPPPPPPAPLPAPVEAPLPGSNPSYISPDQQYLPPGK